MKNTFPEPIKKIVDVTHAITSVEFHGFKAFRHFSLKLQHMNILVGPNNSGKSTILSAFRALAVGLRKAKSVSEEVVEGPGNRQTRGYSISQESLPLSLENVHTDYADTEATIQFRVSNGNKLMLFFPSTGGCNLITDTGGVPTRTPAAFRKAFPISILAVPVLGPVEHEEPLVLEETVRKNLETHRASGNFRNYWHYNPNGFAGFATLVKATWPGMEVELPSTLDKFSLKLTMFCKENRISRELYWAGFGFQVWCQLLTHLSRAEKHSLIIIDEADTYLHPEIQRQLVSILRQLGADIMVATHSTEMMSEADPSEIVLIDKTRKSGQRLKDIGGVQQALEKIGSLQNVKLTELARSQRILFVEGDSDFHVLRGFARKKGYEELASGMGVVAIQSEGFASWKRIRDFAWGLKKVVSSPPEIAAIFDRDYFCEEEIRKMMDELSSHVRISYVHSRKEIENYLLEPTVLDRTVKTLLEDKVRREGGVQIEAPSSLTILMKIAEAMKAEVQGQYISKQLQFYKGEKTDSSIIATAALKTFEKNWSDSSKRMWIVPGKEVFKMFSGFLQENYGINLTFSKIIVNFEEDEIHKDICNLLEQLEEFRHK